MLMIHPEGGARVFAHEKVEHYPDEQGIYAIPDGATTIARAQGFVTAPPQVAVAVSPEELALAAAVLDRPVPPLATVPMRAPEECQSASLAGEEFVIPSDRVCEVPVGSVEAFRAFGFVAVDEE